GERAHLELPVRALDVRDLAGAIGARDELAQVIVRPIVGVEALGVEALGSGFFQHGVSLRSCCVGSATAVPGCHAHSRAGPVLALPPRGGGQLGAATKKKG